MSRALLLSLLTSSASFAAVILDTGITTLAANSLVSTQSGRLSRNGVPSDWSAKSAFPGIVNAGTPYAYQTYVVPVSPFPYLQISFFDASGTAALFDAAYLNSYNPVSGLNLNYLGDAGTSGNYFGSDPVTFQVVLPSVTTNHLVIVVNDTTASGAGLSQSFNLLVEGFYDTSFNDTNLPAATPEPASIALTGAGVLAAGMLASFRHRRNG